MLFVRCLEFAQGKTLSRGFFDKYSFKQLRQETRGQWQKCYGEAFMSIYLFNQMTSHMYYSTRNVACTSCIQYSEVNSNRPIDEIHV